MRQLSKQPKPRVLVANEEVWTSDYVGAPESERTRYERWRHAEIKAGLQVETGGRCAYCESNIEDVSYPHVEHIRPKSRFPELAHHWSNLTSACAQCNTAKGDYFDEEWPVLNPYEDCVSDHIRFLGDFIDWKLGETRGELTVKKLGLNRLELVRARLK